MTVIAGINGAVFGDKYNYVACDSIIYDDHGVRYLDNTQKSMEFGKVVLAGAGDLTAVHRAFRAFRDYGIDDLAKCKDSLAVEDFVKSAVEDDIEGNFDIVVANPYGIYHLENDDSVTTNLDGVVSAGVGSTFFLGAWAYAAQQTGLAFPTSIEECYEAVYKCCMGTHGPTRIMRVPIAKK